MPTNDETAKKVARHIRQWKHNRRFAKTIDAAYRDWQITAIFYTALHLIDAALAKLGVTVSDHAQRNKEVRSNGVFATVRTSYLDLFRIGLVTRYDAEPDLWLPEEYLTMQDLVENLLKPIENGLAPILGKDVVFQPIDMKE